MRKTTLCKKSSESTGCSSSLIGQKNILRGQSEAGNLNGSGTGSVRVKCPGACLDLIVNFQHGHLINPTNCPWLSADGVVTVKVQHEKVFFNVIEVLNYIPIVFVNLNEE